jgi:Putative phage holin Dp-1
MRLSNRTYNALKFVALVLLPGFSAAYFSLAQIWGLPNAEQVIGTATTLDTLLGLLLKASTTAYEKDPWSGPDAAEPDGMLVVYKDEADGEKYLKLHVDQATIDSLESRTTVKLGVAVHSPLPPADPA